MLEEKNSWIKDWILSIIILSTQEALLMITAFSPTVKQAYQQKSDWFSISSKHTGIDEQGYNGYGYHNQTGLDRAGFSHEDYINNAEYFENAGYYSPLYEQIESEWHFSQKENLPVYQGSQHKKAA